MAGRRRRREVTIGVPVAPVVLRRSPLHLHEFGTVGVIVVLVPDGHPPGGLWHVATA